MQIPIRLHNALQDAAHRLNKAGRLWLVGGSCGLLLQHVHLEKLPRDIDVYADAASIQNFHLSLADRSIDAPETSETDMYHSILSHYQIDSYVLELVGGFEIRSSESRYTVEVEQLLQFAAPAVELEDVQIKLMPLGHELLFNILRAREDRYEAIASAIKLNPSGHIELIKDLLKRNAFSYRHVLIMSTLLEEPSLLDYAARSNDEEG